MSKRDRELTTSPTQGMEDENTDTDSVLEKPQPKSTTAQLTNVVLVLSTLLVTYGLYTGIDSSVYVVDWLKEWRTDGFRWIRAFQALLGFTTAAISLLGVQSAYAAVPLARQVKLGSTFVTALVVVLGLQAVVTLASILWVVCDGVSGLAHPSVHSSLSVLVSVASLGGVLIVASVLRNRAVREEEALQTV
jgi:hypothetical protein